MDVVTFCFFIKIKILLLFTWLTYFHKCKMGCFSNCLVHKGLCSQVLAYVQLLWVCLPWNMMVRIIFCHNEVEPGLWSTVPAIRFVTVSSGHLMQQFITCRLFRLSLVNRGEKKRNTYLHNYKKVVSDI